MDLLRDERREQYFKKYPSKRPVPPKKPELPVNKTYSDKNKEFRTKLDESIENVQILRRRRYYENNTNTNNSNICLGTEPSDQDYIKYLINDINKQHAINDIRSTENIKLKPKNENVEIKKTQE